MSAFRFFRSGGRTWNHAGNLPHWRQAGVTYFVTFRLADSLPQDKLAQLRAEREQWLRAHPLPHDELTHQVYVQRFVARVERWLDAGAGTCLLGDARCRQAVERAMRHFDGQRYQLDEFVVMPNHVHVLLMPYEGEALSEILHSWKSYTAKEINRLYARSGTVWQRESYDHIVRSSEQMERFRRYIQQNPEWWRWKSNAR